MTKSEKATPKYRNDTTEPHALFEGRRELYESDQAWRADIPKATADRPRKRKNDDAK